MWNSVEDFFLMGGYAFYVWMSFGLCLSLMILEPLWIANYRKQVMRRIQQQQIAKKYQKG
jgi:heme exporter protein D